MIESFSEALLRAVDCLGVSLADEQVVKMYAHFERVIETNKQFNLTRIVDPVVAAARLYADSLAPLAWSGLTGVSRMLDVGTGAGFPSVPVAIARPAWKVTALDSTGKKARFVGQCAKEMPLKNLEAVQGRAGQWRSRHKYGLVLFKAVGPLERCLSACRGVVDRDGFVMCFKGPGLKRSEVDAGEVAANQVGLHIWDTVDYDLPCGDEVLEHTLFIYRRG